MDVNITMRPDAVALVRSENTKASSKHAVLSHLADIFEKVYGLDSVHIIDGLEQREALGSTGFGKGVAIPHCRSDQVARPTVVLLKLEAPCEFDAVDAVPVSLVFGLVSPENGGSVHLHALAAISRLVRDEEWLKTLLDAGDSEAIFAVLTNQFLRDAA